jgi:hypothetical protein
MPSPVKTERVVAIAALAGIVVMAIGGKLAVDHYTSRLTAAAAKTEAALVQAAGFRQIAAAEAARADSAQARATALEQKTNDIKRKAVGLAAKADVLALQAPDTCAPAVEAMRAARDTALSALATATQTIAAQKESLGHLQGAQRADNAALDVVVPAAETLAKVSHEGFFARVLPKVDPGVAVGLDKTGKPNIVVGLTLHW